jgi:hypothetical protein
MPREAILWRMVLQPCPPAIHRYSRPYGLNQPERPGALQEAIRRSHSARGCERESEPWVTVLQRIEDQHCGDGKKTEKRKGIHVS